MQGRIQRPSEAIHKPRVHSLFPPRGSMTTCDIFCPRGLCHSSIYRSDGAKRGEGCDRTGRRKTGSSAVVAGGRDLVRFLSPDSLQILPNLVSKVNNPDHSFTCWCEDATDEAFTAAREDNLNQRSLS